MRLDDIDRSIVASLASDGRRSYREVGDEVGLSAAATKRRVDRLRDAGALAITARIDPSAVGRGTAAFVELFCEGRVPPDRIGVGLAGLDEVVAAYTVTGDADAIVHVVVRDTSHLEEALERIRELPFVTKTRSTVVLSRLVERAPSVGDQLAVDLPDDDG